MHVQNVFLHYHYQELLFPYGYYATTTENSDPFLGLRENNSAKAQVEGKWHFLTATLSATVLTLIFLLHRHGRWVTQRRNSAPEKGLQLTQSKGMGMSLFISSWAAVHSSQSCKTRSLWPRSSEAQRHGFTEVAQMLQGNCMIRVLWLQVRIPPSGFALSF